MFRARDLVNTTTTRHRYVSGYCTATDDRVEGAHCIVNAENTVYLPHFPPPPDREKSTRGTLTETQRRLTTLRHSIAIAGDVTQPGITRNAAPYSCPLTTPCFLAQPPSSAAAGVRADTGRATA